MLLAEMKELLRIDYDDDTALQLYMDAAQEYIEDAVGVYDDNSARMRVLLALLTADFYENRTYTLTEKTDSDRLYSIKSLVLQLQLKYGDVENG